MSKAFSSIAEYDNNIVMIVDLLNLSFRWKHAKSFEFTDEFIKVIQSLRKSYKAKYVILACDEGSSSYRKSIYPEYKANRAEKYATQTPEEELEFKLFFEEFNNTIKVIQEQDLFPVLKFNKVEADDIAAYLVQALPKHFNIEHIWLISSDKDWNLLVNGTTSQFSYVTRKEITLDNWNDHHDCTPEEYISIKCLMGDSGDNIKGVEGIGPKRAHDLVKQYGSALDIYNNLPISSKYKYVQALNASEDLIITNYKLMDLVTFSEEAIGEANTATINARMSAYLKDIKNV